MHDHGYAGWYDGDIDEWADYIERVKKCRAELQLEALPIAISKFGAVAIYGHDTFEDNK